MESERFFDFFTSQSSVDGESILRGWSGFVWVGYETPFSGFVIKHMSLPVYLVKWDLKALDFLHSRNVVKLLGKQRSRSVKFHNLRSLHTRWSPSETRSDLPNLGNHLALLIWFHASPASSESSHKSIVKTQQSGI